MLGHGARPFAAVGPDQRSRGIAVTPDRGEWSVGPGARLDLRSVGEKPGFPVVFLQGEFDIETVPEIDRFLRRSFGPLFYKRHIVLDLNEVTAVDSIFIGFVVGLVRRLHMVGHHHPGASYWLWSLLLDRRAPVRRGSAP